MIDMSHIFIQILVRFNALLVAFEMNNVNGIKPDERHEKSNIHDRELVAEEVLPPLKHGIGSVQTFEQIRAGVIVGLLSLRKTRLVNAVVDGVVDPVVI